MTFIVYDENEKRDFSGGIDFSRIDPNKPHLRHLKNYYYLRFIANHTDTDVIEKQQANNELVICERKMAYWERQVTFNQSTKEEAIAELERQWAS